MGNFDRKVLVLDARFEAVKVLSLQAGFVLLYAGRATTIIESDRTIRSVTKVFLVPWVIQLENSSPKRLNQGGPRFSRQNVYLRDNYRCQYCGWTGPVTQLTLDHLVPLAKGGPTSWGNIVTACKDCNLKKGMRTPEEVGLKLQRPPVQPHFRASSLFPLRYGLTCNNIPEVWIPFVDLSAVQRLSQFHDVPNKVPNKVTGSRGKPKTAA